MIKDEFNVSKIPQGETYSFLKNNHYAKRVPSISYSFGLFNNKKLVGVVTYGLPPAPNEYVFWRDEGFNLLELNRLFTIDNLPKNTLSFFVSKSLKLLKEIDEFVIISYADMDHNHKGYIYQATSWLYSGIGSVGSESYITDDGKEKHSRHMHLLNGKIKLEKKISKGKYRYYYFIGDKRRKKQFILSYHKRYKNESYPKGKNINYDIGKTSFQTRTLNF